MLTVCYDLLQQLRNGLLVLVPVLFLIVTANVASATQVQSVNSLQKEFDSTFQTMLDDPSDIDTTLRYANLAVQLKDYEAAIPALERILLFNPSLAKVKQELGVLYYRLKSYEVALSYLNDAANSADASSEVKETSQKWIQKIKEFKEERE